MKQYVTWALSVGMVSTAAVSISLVVTGHVREALQAGGFGAGILALVFILFVLMYGAWLTAN